MDTLEESIQMIREMKLKKCGMNSTKNARSDICPICQGTGTELYYKGNYEYARECKCGAWKKKMQESRISFADIPESFKDVRLKDFDKTIYNTSDGRNKSLNALKGVNYWLNNFEALKGQGKGLYIYSQTKGSGKTRMAVSIANELILEKEIQVKFCTSLQILNEIKASWDRENDYTESKLLNFLSTSEVLIIDDFGTEQSDKPWINERFYQIINNRYINKKVTIFTSNERLDNLKYDDRITNRIKERTFQIPFPEESVRDIIAKKNMQEMIAGIRNEVEK